MTDSNNDRLAKMKRRLLETEVLCQCYDLVNANATDYVTTLIQQWYTINDAGEFQTTSETPLGMDLKPMPVDQVGNYLREKHSYLFRESRPAFVSHATTVTPPPNKSEMTLAQKCEFIRVNGEQAFLNLPNNPTEAKPLIERPRSAWTTEEKADFVRRHGSEEYFKIPA